MNLRMEAILKSMWGETEGRHLAGSAVASALVHAGLILLCAFWLLPSSHSTQPLLIETVWDEPGEEIAFDPLPLSVATISTDSDAGGASAGTAMFQRAVSDAAQETAVAVRDPVFLDGPQAEVIDPSLYSQMVSLAGGGGYGTDGRSGGGDGSGLASGSGAGSSAFFGRPVDGRRVVYVVDASQSMNHPHPGPMLTRFGRVKLELIRSISQLAPEQQFFIVYFNDQALPMPARTMAPATPGTREKYLRWAAQVQAGGRTDPEQALALALYLKPDVVYFLTDGNFPGKIVKQVAEANRQKVIIHTIGFADDEGEELLKRIAAQNWGQYQFIPIDEAEAVSVDASDS